MEGIQVANADIDGRRWRYYTAGDIEGMPLLMVHGFRSSARFFRHAMLSLSDKWYVVAPDLPGHGDSDPIIPANIR